MESSDTTKSMMMFGLGITALVSAFQVYRLSKKLEEKEKEKKESKKRNKGQSVQETLQTMLMMEMSKRLQSDQTTGRIRTGSYDSVEVHAR